VIPHRSLLGTASSIARHPREDGTDRGADGHRPHRVNRDLPGHAEAIEIVDDARQ
jgi:hypothetical protein